MNPLMRLLTHHPPEAQFSWPALKEKLDAASLRVTRNSVQANAIQVIGVATKNRLRQARDGWPRPNL